MQKYIKSPLNYTGGKNKLLDEIIPLFPTKIDNFIDLFAGGLNVGVNVDANCVYVNDHISYLIELYKIFKNMDLSDIIHHIYSRIEKYDLSELNQDGYLFLRDEYNRSKQVLDLFVLVCYSFNHQIRFNNKHEFNMPFGANRSKYNATIETNLANFIQKLKDGNYVFSNLDFMDFNFDSFGSNDFVYCDPPYLLSNVAYNDGKRGHKNWTKTEEMQLLDLLDNLHKRGIKFALSNVLFHKGVTNDILIDWSKKYNMYYIDVDYSNCNYQLKSKDLQTKEVLITNY